MKTNSKVYELNAWRDNNITINCTQGEYSELTFTGSSLTDIKGKKINFQLYDGDGLIDLSDVDEVYYDAVNEQGEQSACDALVINKTTNTVILGLSKAMTSKSGKVKGEIRLVTSKVDGNNKITSTNTKFYGVNLKVNKSNDDGGLIGNPQFSELEKLITYVKIAAKITDEGIDFAKYLIDDSSVATNKTYSSAKVEEIVTIAREKSDSNKEQIDQLKGDINKLNVNKVNNADFNTYKSTNDTAVSKNATDILSINSSLNLFGKNNLSSKLNSEKTGYFSSTNTNNKGSFNDGTYSISTSSDNTERAKWVFNYELQVEKGTYFIAFDYVTNTNFNVGLRINGAYNDIGKIGAITDGKKHTFVTSVDIDTSVGLYEVYMPNTGDIDCKIDNIKIMTQFDYAKSYSNIEDYLLYNDMHEVTPELFGAVGNGQFDDTIALQNAINYCIENGTQLKCQNGKTYCISNPLDLSNTAICLIDFNWSILKAIKTMDYMITFDGSANIRNDVKTLLKNVIIDCNFKAGGLDLIYSFKFTFDSFMVKNCQTTAIWIQKGGAFVCQNGTIIGNCTPDSRGIYNQTSDCHFHEIVIVDMKKCIFNGGTNFYHKVHGWLTSKVANSIFFEHFAGFGSLSHCQCDTYETGYLMRTSYDLSLVACTYYNNYHLYDSDVTPVVFKFNSGIHPYARRICCTNCSFNSPNLVTTLSSVTDAQITFNGYTHFINIAGYDKISRISPTLQAKVTSDFDGSVNKLTYRNGLCYYDFSLQFTSTIGASNLLEIATIQSPYYPLENQMFPCYLTKTLAGSDCIVGKLLIDTNGKVQVRVPSGSVADYQYLYAHCYYEPKAIGE